MSRPDYKVREKYIGNGSLATYSFDFKIENLDHLLVVELDDTGTSVFEVRGTDTTYLDDVTFDSTKGGGSVTLKANLTQDHTLILLLANDEPTQPYEFRDKKSFSLATFEAALDFIAGAVQRLAYLSRRAFKLSDSTDENFNPTLDIPPNSDGKLLKVTGSGDGIELGPVADSITQGIIDLQDEMNQAQNDINDLREDVDNIIAETLPVGGNTNDYLAKKSAADGDVEWVSGGKTGWSKTLNKMITTLSLGESLDELFDFDYVPPTLSFTASGSTTIREKGDAVTATTLSATVGKTAEDITEVRFYKGVDLIHTESSPNPAGDTVNYNWTGSFSDNTTFSVQVDDTTGSNKASASRTFTFVYPYYVGAGAASLPAASVAGLTKRLITSTASRQETITATAGQVLYFAYPASYGDLTSILDANNFETISDWTKRTENITGLDSNPVSYLIYEFKNPVVAGSYQYTFKR